MLAMKVVEETFRQVLQRSGACGANRFLCIYIYEDFEIN